MAECAVDTAQPARIKLDQKAWDRVMAVNRKVNAAIKPTTDQDHWNEPDRWDLAEDGNGDSEEYALVKRRNLVGFGIPRRALRLTIVIDEKGEGHMVLTVITDRGDYILDSKTTEILACHRTGYVFIKRESQETPAWVSLGGVTSPVTTNR